MPCLAYTHLQPAQLTTVGKRADAVDERAGASTSKTWSSRLDLACRLLGSKGTTGTQASFMELFDGDEEKVLRLEQHDRRGDGLFQACVPVSGQTYSRKVDAYVLSRALRHRPERLQVLPTTCACSQSFEEMEEPFEKNQIGSSAMPYKRNPMRSERICALARYVIQSTRSTPAMTAGTQWFERTLDDSANKRIAVSEAFLAVDAILNIYINVTRRPGGV